MGLSHKQIAALHVAKKHLALTDLEYRAALEAHAGVSSAKDPCFGLEAYRQVMAHFQHCGFRPKNEPVKAGMPATFYDPRIFTGTGGRMATRKQLWRIHRDWWNLRGRYWGQDVRPDSYPEAGRKSLCRFLSKRFRVDHPRFLTFRQTHGVIEAIKRISASEGCPC